MKAIFFLVLLGISFSLQTLQPNAVKQEVCLDNIKQQLPDICKEYEFECETCFEKEYLEKCMILKDDLTCDNCDKNCKDEDHYCKNKKEKCDNCIKKWITCSCPEGTALNIYNDGNRKCELLPCKEGTWRKADSKCTTCYACDEKCEECSGSATNCPVCKENYCLVEKNKCVDPKEYVCPNANEVKYYLADKCPSCIKECPKGWYAKNRVCYKCNERCQSCTGSATHCDLCHDPYCLYKNKCQTEEELTCDAGTFKFNFKDDNDKCPKCVTCPNCPEGSWCNESTHVCDFDCAYPKFILNKKCIDSCSEVKADTKVTFNEWTHDPVLITQYSNFFGWTSPQGTFKAYQCGNDLLIGGYNQFGKDRTLQYTEQLPSHTKLIIEFKLFLIDSWDHPTDYFILNVDGKIYKYFKKGLANNVQSGSTQTATNIHRCGAGWFDDVQDIRLEIAHTSSQIQIIFGSGQDQAPDDESWGVSNVKLSFVAVPGHRFLIYDPPSGNKCVSCQSCPADTYCDEKTYECKECKSPKFIWQRKCISQCPKPSFLKVVKGEMTCTQDCGDGFFGNDVTRKCEPCDANCKTCAGSATTCLYPCPQGLIWFNSKCYSECDIGQYISGQNADEPCDPKNGGECKCRGCHSSCSRCIGGTDTDCYQCADESKLLQNGRCQQECSLGHFNDKTDKICHCCDESCYECDGPTNNECTSCQAGDRLIGGACYSEAHVALLLQQNKKF